MADEIRKHFDVDDLIRRYASGESMQSLGRRFGVSYETIRRRLVSNGIPVRPTNAGDLEAAIRVYVAGENLRPACKIGRVSDTTLKHELQKRGLFRTDKTAQQLGAESRKRKYDVLSEIIVPRYLAGEPSTKLSEEFGIARSVIRRIVKDGGHHWRTPSENARMRAARMSPEERKANARAAHDAARGREHSFEEKCKRAQTVERKQLHTSPAEILLRDWLIERGIESIPQKAIGPYNADLGAAPVAVEIFGGSWHNAGSHAARTPDRARYILDQGWNLIIVWNDIRLAAFTPDLANYIVAFHERSRRDPSFRGEYRVVWSDGKEASPLSPDLDDIALKPSRSGRKRRRA